ncbi:hypothetical protein EUTSA_v10021229mg [Eutrema salsugineum]|uniref:DUF506 domain-containing protein n=1 Tax=Eutrema salsugineum TaxID=72664 RepID=V4MA41_EUTSA|nr:uncharacterized protein LOC18024624 [Eutrema salsugineum]ESQ49298.1 hypothetical protein EUTSA_v10021229mg [Eutrema salsugineum]
MGFSRAKRVTDPLADEVRARLVGCSFSSGSEHTGYGIEDDDDDSPCLSDLVQGFLEDEVETVKDEPRWCDHDSGSDSDSDSERVELPDFADDIAKHLRNSLREDSYGRTVLLHVARAMEMLSSPGSDHEHRAVLRRKLMSLLRELGHNAAICKTKWKSSGGLTAGNHEFIDVVHSPAAATSSQTVRYIVDFDFASHFKIARPTAQYARVLQSLPAIFVGRGEDLKRILRLVCDAARMSLKSRDLTLPPWRKNRYMQTRWLGPYKRSVNLTPSSPAVNTVMCRSIGFDNAVGGRLFVRTR